MVDGILQFGHGEVRLGGELLPGILKSFQIAGAVRFDEAERDGLSGKVKIPMGWEDADCVLVVELPTDGENDTCYHKLARLDGVFKGIDNKANPKIYTVSNPHLSARRVRQVIFSGLESQETDQEDVLLATLRFQEHKPPITAPEERVTAGGSTPAPSTGSAPEPALDPGLEVDLS